MILVLLAVLAGGFLGGVVRWAFRQAVPGHYATFIANILGASAFGLTMGVAGAASLALTHPGIVGGLAFAGGLSTWSTFAKELGEMLKSKRYWEFFKYFAGTTVIGIIVAWRGTIWAARIVYGV